MPKILVRSNAAGSFYLHLPLIRGNWDAKRQREAREQLNKRFAFSRFARLSAKDEMPGDITSIYRQTKVWFLFFSTGDHDFLHFLSHLQQITSAWQFYPVGSLHGQSGMVSSAGKRVHH